MPVFGPVPSRRLGRSIGVNNIPPKSCTYACVYCQVGRTTDMRMERRTFFTPEQLYDEVKTKLEEAENRNEHVDYLTFVPDGEPTLDENLEFTIEKLKDLGQKIGVITNSSIINREDVQSALMKADWVSVKVDSVQRDVWKKINRPYPKLDLDVILEGILGFSRKFTGKLVTETLLVKGINDDEENLRKNAVFISGLNPSAAYISTPIRPPAESWVKAADPESLNRAYQIYSGEMTNVEFLINYEGDNFSLTGDIERDILSITAVHPMRRQAVLKVIEKGKGNNSILDNLVKQGALVRKEFKGEEFFLRAFTKKT